MQKDTGKLYAIKIINKDKTCGKDRKKMEQLVREIEILRKITHENCVGYHGLIEGEKYIYIILEYVEGGELFTKLMEDGAVQVSAEFY
jgi:5'-AMP-activated protein kinase catalytic alpha subunit